MSKIYKKLFLLLSIISLLSIFTIIKTSQPTIVSVIDYSPSFIGTTDTDGDT